MDKGPEPSNRPVTDYELERIREEQILDGWRGERSDAPLPKDPDEESHVAGGHSRRRKPLD